MEEQLETGNITYFEGSRKPRNSNGFLKAEKNKKMDAPFEPPVKTQTY